MCKCYEDSDNNMFPIQKEKYNLNLQFIRLKFHTSD